MPLKEHRSPKNKGKDLKRGNFEESAKRWFLRAYRR
jgi:hypothetical protein